MFLSKTQLALPRRVVAWHLLFSLGAIVLLASGAVFAVQGMARSRAAGGALTRVGRLAAAIEMDHVRTGGVNTQSLIERAQTSGYLRYAAVVGPEGRYAAHINQRLVGQIDVPPPGTHLSWGSIDGVRFKDANGRCVEEYRAPLHVDEAPIGTLVLAIAEPDWYDSAMGLAAHAPTAVVAAVGLIGVGAWWLRRAARPLAEIEGKLSQIATLPHGQTPAIDPVTPRGLAAIGWNRIVDEARRLALATQGDRAEARLRRLAEFGGGRTREALESIPEGVVVTDPEGRVEFANRAVAALLGADDQFLGQPMAELLRVASPEAAVDAYTGRMEVVSELPVTAGESVRTLRVARTPLRDDPSAGAVWSVRDVTQQKLAERSRDQFIDTATHEMRTPLANIKAYAETLAMCDMTDVEEQKEFCNTINTEATRLARFVDDLLSISSLEVGSLAIERQNVNVRRLLEEAAAKVRPLADQKGLRFDVALGEKLGEAALDKDKISGLVVNLLGNAVKYTPNGGTVSLNAARQEDQIKIEVRDTGVGIADDEQSQVFDKFFRSENPDVQDQVGTGLGLSLAREIARLHRGDLTLESRLGEGSLFVATLPAK